jgi:predicted nucleic acid-binding protein
MLVWGIRKLGTTDQNQRAIWLFQQLEEDEAQIILPTVAVSEYLTPLDPATHDAIITELGRRFILAPFDIKSAALAARIYAENKNIQLQIQNQPNARKTLRADCLIVATARIHGARIFYSGDTGCRSLASKISGIEARDLPAQPPNLFGGPLKT